MNKNIIVLVVVGFVIIAAIMEAGISRYGYKTVPQASAPANLAASTAAQGSNSTATIQESVAEVNIQNFSFNPAEVSIKTGGTVRWTNKDSALHKIIINGITESQMMAQDGSFEFSFAKAGAYSYICSIHPSMKGIVTVTE
ncbi:MAG: cupredoxin family copper-binding protein [Candidatus Jorgensenbacteria bacterium]|nr:cupredoxin family copper-binding protein [Candidatus Jorgensenbacteria bacterium]